MVLWQGWNRLSPDLRQLVRKLKPDKRLEQLRTRPLDKLISASLMTGGRVALVPDTNVYIRSAAGNLPELVSALLDRSLQYHCSVCLSELAVGVGAYSPLAKGWPAVRDHYTALFAAIPDGRVVAPDAEVWTTAGLVAGTLARTQGFNREARKECLNDALILLTAAKAGLPVLTANRGEFDLIQQVAGQGTFLHY